MSSPAQMEKYALIKKAIDEETESHTENIKICFDLMEKAIERNFKIQSTLGTFCLVGIFTLLSWGKITFDTYSGFPLTKYWMVLSVFLHSIALFLLAYKNTLSAEMQVWKQELNNTVFTERTRLLAVNNAALPDNQVFLYPSVEELEKINKMALPYSDKIKKIAPKIFKTNKVVNWMFFISIISTLLFVLSSLKLEV